MGHTSVVEHSFELHRSRRRLFTTDATGYADGRPGYPPEVFDIVERRCGPLAGSRVLEIGPGTGQATGPLLDAGATVLAVELGGELAAQLAERHRGRPLKVVVGAFETADLATDDVDLVAAATSFHWVEPSIGLQRCADVLRPGGSLALWWNYFGDPARPDPFHEALQPVLQRHAPELIDTTDSGTGTHPYALDSAARIAEIDAAGLFSPVAYDTVAWTGEHTAAEIRRLFGSFSPFLALAEDRRTILLDAIEQLAHREFEGRVTRPYLTLLYTATLRERT